MAMKISILTWESRIVDQPAKIQNKDKISVIGCPLSVVILVRVPEISWVRWVPEICKLDRHTSEIVWVIDLKYVCDP